jgi:hypothetical protein
MAADESLVTTFGMFVAYSMRGMISWDDDASTGKLLVLDFSPDFFKDPYQNRRINHSSHI